MKGVNDTIVQNELINDSDELKFMEFKNFNFLPSIEFGLVTDNFLTEKLYDDDIDILNDLSDSP